jgi:hypothetical protein
VSGVSKMERRQKIRYGVREGRFGGGAWIISRGPRTNGNRGGEWRMIVCRDSCYFCIFFRPFEGFCDVRMAATGLKGYDLPTYQPTITSRQLI